MKILSSPESSSVSKMTPRDVPMRMGAVLLKSESNEGNLYRGSRCSLSVFTLVDVIAMAQHTITNLSEVLLEFHATAVTRLPRILEDILCREDFLQAFNLFLTQTSRKMTRYCY